MPATKRSNRKEQILQALAQMLETSLGQRITTAKLAAEVGVSEAALYRHFPSKARMFEGLIEFIEETFNIMDADQSGDLDEGEFLSKFMVFMDNLCGKLQTGAETVVADVRKLKNKEFLACLQNANTAKGGNLQRSGGGSCCVVC